MNLSCNKSTIRYPLCIAVAAILASAPSLHAQESAPTPAPAAKATLPDAKLIVEKSVAAIGGREAWSKRKSMEMKGTIDLPGQNIKGTIFSRTAQPNKMATVITLSGLGEFRTGFDGTIGWSSDKLSGTRLMTGKELATIAREADYMKDVDPFRRWEKMETTGEGSFGSFDCWKISASKGEEKATLWFEKTTSLPRGFEMTVDTQLGKLAVVTIFVEYKDFDGIKLPVRSEAAQGGQKIITTYDSVTHDTVDPTAFDLPPEVKALLEPEPADEDDVPPPAPKPETTKPETTKPETTKPETTKPEVPKPEVPKPATPKI